MAKYRQVHVSFWQDPFVLELTPEEKYFYLYLMTNSKTSACGIYELPMKVIELETGYNRETVEKLLTRFVEHGKVIYSNINREIYLVNWIRYNQPKGPATTACVVDELNRVKTREFADRYIREAEALGYPLEGAYRGPTDPRGEKETETEKETEKETPPSEGGPPRNGKHARTPPCPQEKIIDLYHEILFMCPKVKDWHETRQALLRARWRSHPKRQNLDWWRKFFEYVAKSKFLTGQTEPRNGSPPFIADLEWLLRPSNFAKVIEGKYER
ncbi:MAG TPA: hypothetical protein VF193_09655 [Steroidobacter sp.]|jgi:hypothetical protein